MLRRLAVMGVAISSAAMMPIRLRVMGVCGFTMLVGMTDLLRSRLLQLGRLRRMVVAAIAMDMPAAGCGHGLILRG